MKQLYKRASQTITQQQDKLAEAIVERQYALQPEIWLPFGEEGRAKSVRDANYHLSYLVEALDAAAPALFLNYIAWVKTLFAGLGFSDAALLKTLECTRDVLQEELAGELTAATDEYLEAGLQHMRQSPSLPPSFIQQDQPLAELAQQYLEALLQGQRHVASQLILNAVQAGVSVRDVYLYVFQPVQHEVGRLWQTNQVSVAQEHYCTAATQLIMSQLYPYIFATEKIGRRLVATCIGGELHEIGVRMVADFFEMEGWDTYYLGANTPAESILQTIEEREPDVLGISATITFHTGAVESLIDRVRDSDVGADVKILVGGYPFNLASNLWQKVGADGYARNAQEAIIKANQLVAKAG
jgi:methanogenic corrinoid protein MtbC1